MQFDTSGINRRELMQAINEHYFIGVSELTFLPRGEDAYTYLAQTVRDQRFFVRAQPLAREILPLGRAYAILHALHHRYGISGAVAPRMTHNGFPVLHHNGYAVAVFPYIEGRSLYEIGASPADLQQVAVLLAQVHGSAGRFLPSTLPQETCTDAFRQPLLRVLAESGGDGSQPHYPQRVRALLAEERTNIVATMVRLNRLGAAAQEATDDWVLTHGDPNLDNFLKDDAGALHLTDWGDIALGPPERDLFAFVDLGDGFEIVLRTYLEERPKATLHAEIFAYYLYRWALQEIADYATRILFTAGSLAEEEHAWSELQPYLPIRHAQIAQHIEEVHAVLARVQTQ